MNKNIRAFWKYDTFPYCLSGEITDINLNGDIETKEYGAKRYFKPDYILIVLPNDSGLEIKKNLEKLEQEYRKAQETLLKTYLKKAIEIAPFLEKHESIKRVMNESR